MAYTFYRSYDDAIPAKGFEAWVQLELPDIKKLITRFNGKYTAPIIFQETRAKWLSDAIFERNRQPLFLGDLGKLIKSKVDHSTIQISTDLTNEGGGREKKHLYQITCTKTLYFVDPSNGSYQANPASLDIKVKPKLVMDSPTLANAELIAISLWGHEIAFLTRIPRNWINTIF